MHRLVLPIFSDQMVRNDGSGSAGNSTTSDADNRLENRTELLKIVSAYH